MLLKDKVALVTGGSRGIGREIILKFLQNGAKVCYIDLQQGDSFAEYEALAAENGGSITYKQGSVAEEDVVNTLVDEIISELGRIDVVVNNAGITRDGLLMRMSSQDWFDVLNVNLSSAFYVSKAVTRPMLKQKAGSIINIASIVGVIGNGGQVNYSASKAGLIGVTKSMAREVASRGVRVNAVAPGFIVTPMTDKLSQEQKDALLGQIPLGRLGEPEEVAKVVLFLASELSSYLTGEVIKIAGGMGM